MNYDPPDRISRIVYFNFLNYQALLLNNWFGGWLAARQWAKNQKEMLHCSNPDHLNLIASSGVAPVGIGIPFSILSTAKKVDEMGCLLITHLTFYANGQSSYHCGRFAHFDGGGASDWFLFILPSRRSSR